MSRTKMFLQAFFTGSVDDIQPAVLQRMQKNWMKLTTEAQSEFLHDLEQQSRSRRESMFEAATRSNYLMVVAAFVIAANVAILVASDKDIARHVLLTISTSLIALAAAVLTLAISAKSKVMRKPDEGSEIEAESLLSRTVEIVAYATSMSDPNLGQWHKVTSVSNKLQKRKIILVVERRAQWMAAVLMSLGLIIMIIGLCLS